MNTIEYLIMLVVDAFAIGFVLGVIAMKMKICKKQNGHYNFLIRGR